MEPSPQTNIAPPPAGAATHPGDAFDSADEVVIQPKRGWIGVEWSELVRYRELLYFFVWRDFKVKYKQAILGVGWSVIVPLMFLAIYAVIATFINGGASLRSTGVPVVLWTFCGLVPWNFLQRSITDGGASLLNNQHLMTKVYLPRLYLPTAAVSNGLVDMAIALGLLALIGTYYHFSMGFVPSWQIVFVPLLVLLAFIAGLGIALLLSAATVLYRDLRFLTPLAAQVGVWVSGVALDVHVFKPWKQALFALNPFTGIIYGFRSAITGEPWQWLYLGSSIVLSIGLLVFGLFYFRRVERRFADIA
ncbi:MAG: ABC transporter permease [Tepidisphaeraceae bacterium]